MVSRDEAVQRARAWLSAGTRVPADAELAVHEFDLGYVVWLRLPPGPAPASTAMILVDRATGELSSWPEIPPATIAEQYTAEWLARLRFPADVLDDLRAAGWRPGRDEATSVGQWLAHTGIEQALPSFPLALSALREFGGLSIPQRGPTGQAGGGYTSMFYPGPDFRGPAAQPLVEFGRLIGAAVFPVGANADGPSELVVDEHGRVFRLNDVVHFHLADSLDEALIWVTRGGQRPVIDDYGRL